jgi:hypothetical protein
MALVSPGVQVTVIDESFYTPAEPGTTPLIVIATGQDKLNGAGTATAQGTLRANAGKAFRMTSQRDIVDFFGVPFFEKTPGNSPIHGGERNEYGLLAAYSFMGVSASAFIVRADIDLNQLQGSAVAPGAEPNDGAWWFDTNDTAYGIQEWNGAPVSTTGGQKFATKVPLILTNDDAAKIIAGEPKGSVGSVGDYAIVFQTGDATKEIGRLFYKSSGNSEFGVLAGEWVEVGSQEWKVSWPAVVGSGRADTTAEGGDTFTINGTTITVGDTFEETVANINDANIDGVKALNVSGRLYLYSDGSTEADGDSTRSGAIVIGAGTGLTPAVAQAGASSQQIDASILKISAGTYYPPEFQSSPHTEVPQWRRNSLIDGVTPAPLGRPSGSVWLKTTEPSGGARFRVRRWNSANQAWVAVDAPLYSTGHAANFFLDRSGGGKNIPADSIFVQVNATEDTAYDIDDTPGESPNPAAFDTTHGLATFRLFRRKTTATTSITSNVISPETFTSGVEYEFTIKQSILGNIRLSGAATIQFTGTTNPEADAETIAGFINGAAFTVTVPDTSPGAQPGSTVEQAISNLVRASLTDDNRIVIEHLSGGEIRFTEVANSPVGLLFGSGYNSYTKAGTANFYALRGGVAAGAQEDYLASNWIPLSDSGFAAQNGQPLNEPIDGQLWYNSEFSEVDIMIHDGTTWRGYRNVLSGTRTTGPAVAASNPYTGSTVTGDLWISTADLENYPTIYRYDAELPGIPAKDRWVLIDKTDQITDEGILFADARFGSSGATGNTAASIAELTTSDYLDPDAPDPALYPRGMLLWNLRRSGGNVKRYNNNYIDTGADNTRFTSDNRGLAIAGGESMNNYATDRWTTFSANNEDGSGSFGRKAQRKVVVAAMKSAIDTSEEARDEERRNFNLIACPGYPETLSNLINLNIDRGLTAFVIGDTPLRLRNDATSLINWGTNANLVFDNGDDGIVSFDEYAAVYYPNGFTTDLSGSNAVVPASHMLLRTIALSDQVSFPWFAPAGTRRGGITNATAVGFIDSLSGEFQTVALNEGTRDVLYDLKVNPIPFFVGVGLVAYGQKTRARNASALDRINVARLVVYLRSQLTKLARPYIFEPNDSITRDEIKGAVESLLLELVGLRALFDFAVVCDESNNTPSRIDRNELYVDIAIEPVKAIEFVYIPLRIKNTGEI